jgi:hypothetical protein
MDDGRRKREDGRWKMEDGTDKLLVYKCRRLFCEDSLEVKEIMCKFVACFLKD